MIIYLIKVSLGLSMFFACYYMFFSKDKWFNFNRYYLIAALLISLLLPFMQWQVEWVPTYSLSDQFITAQEHAVPTDSAGNANSILTPSEAKTIDYNLFLISVWCFYMTGVLIFVVRFTKNIYQVVKQIINGEKSEFKGAHLLLTSLKSSPYSFMNFIVVNKKDYGEGRIDEDVMTHELAHCKQWHSIDAIFVELLLILAWWNPLIWIYRTAIKTNHEYLADEAVIKSRANIQGYAYKIIAANQSAKSHLPVSFFNLSQTKNRIIMLTKKKKSSIFLFSGKALAVSVIAFFSCALLAFSSVNPSDNNPFDRKEFVVVIDPGHGDKDPGVQANGYSEKEIVLQIAQKVQSLAKGKKIRLILTRDSDQFMKLNDRVAFADRYQADLFLSIHINGSKNENHQGIEIYYSSEAENAERAAKYGQLLASKLSLHSGANNGTNLIDNNNLFVLREANCPALTLEAGFLTNKQDRRQLARGSKIEKMSQTIVDALVAMSEL